MSTATYQIECAMCLKPFDSQEPWHDGKGNAYCPACISHLRGQATHAPRSTVVCGRCGVTLASMAIDQLGTSGSAYCGPCLDRLSGRSRRREPGIAAPDTPVTVPAGTPGAMPRDATFDVTFEQMLAELPFLAEGDMPAAAAVAGRPPLHQVA